MLCSLVNFFTPALANIGNFELLFSELLCANSEEKFAVQRTISQYRQSLCNALCSSQMLCLYVSGCGYGILSTVIFL